MDTIPNIRDGRASDVDTLAATLTDSFSRDPVMNWVIPRTDLYPLYFRMLIREVYLPRGMIHLEGKGRAAALWLPPEERFEMPPRMSLLNLAWDLLRHEGLRPFVRIHRQGRVFARHMPREPHYYLQFIGCRHAEQGRGIGSALLKCGTRVCDERGLPAYLESSNRLNVPLYERHGFEVQAQEEVAAGGPTAWFMWREPR